MESDDATKPAEPASPSRRSFLTGVAGAGVSAIGLAGAGLAIREASQEPTAEDLAAPGAVSESEITLQVNGRSVNVSVPDHRSLLLVLREDLGLTGTKKGCKPRRMRRVHGPRQRQADLRLPEAREGGRGEADHDDRGAGERRSPSPGPASLHRSRG